MNGWMNEWLDEWMSDWRLKKWGDRWKVEWMDNDRVFTTGCYTLSYIYITRIKHSSNNPFIIHSFIHPSHSSISFIHPIHTSIHSSIYSSIHSSILPFIHPSIHSSIRYISFSSFFVIFSLIVILPWNHIWQRFQRKIHVGERVLWVLIKRVIDTGYYRYCMYMYRICHLKSQLSIYMYNCPCNVHHGSKVMLHGRNHGDKMKLCP